MPQLPMFAIADAKYSPANHQSAFRISCSIPFALCRPEDKKPKNLIAAPPNKQCIYPDPEDQTYCQGPKPEVQTSRPIQHSTIRPLLPPDVKRATQMELGKKTHAPQEKPSLKPRSRVSTMKKHIRPPPQTHSHRERSTHQ